MFTLLHLSDLHRSKDSPVSNEELLSSVLADLRRFPNESPSISPPDAVIVSGDLVRGLPLGAGEYPTALEAQYCEAVDFLKDIADALFGGDRSRILLAPGNHDVDWNAARRAMAPVALPGEDVQKLLASQESPYRWSWTEKCLYRVAKPALYAGRMRHFREMYNDFYAGTSLGFPLECGRAWDLFSLDDGNILACVFDSCTRNDCFCDEGCISPRAIAQSHLALLNERAGTRLQLAVWHHDTQGPPRRSDYLPLDTVRLLIDKGYRVGFHGHQHRSDATPCSIHTSRKHTMAIISSGSLCSGPRQLPPGHSRQYNVVEISDSYAAARVHVREMTIPGVFSRGRLTALGGRSYEDVEWTEAPEAPSAPFTLGGGGVLHLGEQIEGFLRRGLFDDALQALSEHEEQLGSYGRRLRLQALFDGRKFAELLEAIDSPESPDELAMYVRAACETDDFSMAEEALGQAENVEGAPGQLIADLRSFVKAKRGMLL